jgi:hypothetical protein
MIVNSNQRFNFFTNRVVNGWNDLPNHVRMAENINAFKNRLDTWTDEGAVRKRRSRFVAASEQASTAVLAES